MNGKFQSYLKNLGKRYITPAFLAILFASFFLWYITKLSYTYTTEMPFSINVDGEKFRVECLVEATGQRIIAHRYFSKRTLNLRSSDLQMISSPDHEGEYIITPLSLQNAISLRYGDIKIVSVGEIPPLELNR